VIVAVEEISKDKKVIAFKTRRRKHSRSLRGFRREITVLRVVDIIYGEKLEEENIPSIF
jgi:ribosomal protein L21